MLFLKISKELLFENLMNKGPLLINIKITTNLRKKLVHTLPIKRMIQCISYNFKNDSL